MRVAVADCGADWETQGIPATAYGASTAALTCVIIAGADRAIRRRPLVQTCAVAARVAVARHKCGVSGAVSLIGACEIARGIVAVV